MNYLRWLPICGLAGLLALGASARGQTRQAGSYIGFVYPAGGQQGTTFRVNLGGQGLDGVNQVRVSGEGVSAKVVEYFRKIGPQDTSLMREQLNELRRAARVGQVATGPSKQAKARPANVQPAKVKQNTPPPDPATLKMIEDLEKRLAAYVNRPACVSISSLVFLEVTIAPNAEPGARELRLGTPRGFSNPLVFHVGQLPEFSRKPMRTSDFQVLGKEELALRKRPAEEIEQRITLPCIANGQVAPGEVNWYRFEARKGQRLVLSVTARQLVPFLADAVPGWFQPVVAVYDAKGRELAYNDDFHFKPDPTLLFEAPEDGEYLFSITDAIYRGREDFVYRVTIGEVPLVTSVFPLGGQVGKPRKIEMKGWNLELADLMLPPADAGPGLHTLAATKDGFVSNHVPFALDTLPEGWDKEPNNAAPNAQKIQLPVIVNGRMDRAGDQDVFQVEARAGDTIVAEVTARRLDSPLDSVLKITDSAGKLVGFNDDHEDAAAGINTHHADSYLMVTLPADGTYFVHLTDAARQGGEAYGYRLRLSPPKPDFALRVVPSSVAMRGRATAAVSVYALRKDGFTGDIKLSLKDPPDGFFAAPVTLTSKEPSARLALRTTLTETQRPVQLTVQGRATIQDREIVRQAVPAEDRMQAFLWRHLVPAEDLVAWIFDPAYQPPPKRVLPPAVAEAAATRPPSGEAPKFTKGQVTGRLRQLKTLYEEWLLTDEFYARKVAECEAVQ